MQLIPRGVAVELGEPPFAAVRRSGAIFATAMAVPEAAVNEDGGFVFGQEDVGADEAGEASYGGESKSRSRSKRSGRNRNSDVEAEAEAHSMQQGADAHFGAGVLAANAAHVPASPFGR